MPERRLRGLRKYAKPWKRAFAANLRRNMTMPERILWSKLKDKQLGVAVQAQSVVLGYVLDFWLPGPAICVEIDGPCHLARKGYDLKRDLVLKAKGIDTMRFTAAEVMNNLNAVLALIRAKAAQRIR